MTMIRYNEIRDLHPRVKYLLSTKNWCAINEAQVKGGRIDFVAIQRETGVAMIVECKTTIDNIWKTIGQINGYHKALGLPNAVKRLASFQSVTDDQLDALIDNDIEFRLVTPDTPLMGRSLGTDVQEFIYWLTHWEHEPIEGSTSDDWIHNRFAAQEAARLAPIISQFESGNSFPPVPPDSPFRSSNPADWPSPFAIAKPDADVYRSIDDNLDSPERYD
jgi:hypothetical protein